MTAKVLALFFAIGAIGTLAVGQNLPAWKDVPFSGDPQEILKAANSVPTPEGMDAHILVEDMRYTFDASGALHWRLRRIYKIVTANGVSNWGSVSSQYEPWHQERPKLRARVISADGQVHPLNESTISEGPAQEQSQDVLSDAKIVRAPLSGVAVGSVVEEEVSCKELRPLFEAGVARGYGLINSVPTAWVRVSVEAPESLTLRVSTELLPANALRKTSREGRVEYVVEHGPVAASEESPKLLPDDVPRIPQIQFSTGADWKTVASKYSEAVDRQIAGFNAKSYLAKVPANAARRDKIAVLLARLHKEVRYTGIEFGEAAYVPAPPAETLKRKFGDCKDKATVLVAWLRAAGIPAYVALLSSGYGRDIDPQHAGMGIFNHAIVYVPGEPDYWIDATDVHAAVGELTSANRTRLALIAAPDTVALKRIPQASSSDNVSTETREVFLSEYGAARIVETTEVRGASASGFRNSYADPDRKRLREDLEKYVKDHYFAEGLDKFENGDPEDLTKPMWVRTEARKAKRGSTDLTSAAVGIPLWKIAESLPEVLSEEPAKPDKAKPVPPVRTDDFVMRYPHSTIWRYRIVPPPGFRVKKMPEAGTIPLGNAKIVKEFSAAEDGTVTAVFHFDSGKPRLTPAEAEATRKAVVQLGKDQVPLVTFEHVGETLRAAGKIREAIAENRALCEKYPKSAINRTRLATVLLAAGIGEAAREEARKATALDPKSSIAWGTLGWILRHDLMGRLQQKGFDLEGALAAYRKAKELDPEDTDSRTNLAILLEYDADGTRYADKKRLAEAIAEYKELGDEKLKQAGLADNPLFDLLWTERFEELKTASAQGTQTVARRALRVAAIAGLNGPDAGLKELASWNLSEQDRQKIAQGAGNHCMNLRNYPAAAKLLRVAAESASNGAQLLGLAAMLDKTKKTEELDFSGKDPITIVKMIQADAVSLLGRTEQQKTALFLKSRRLVENSQIQALRLMRRQSLATGIPIRVFAEIGFAAMRLSLDGDDDSAQRVRILAEAAGQSGRETYFLDREDGQYKVVAIGLSTAETEIGMLGQLARTRVQAGKLAGARQLLDWAQELSAAGQANDPLSGMPFARLWEPGNVSASSDELLTAAAALEASAPEPTEAALEQLKKAAALPAFSNQLAQIQSAMVTIYSKQKKWSEASELTAKLLARYPRSASALSNHVSILTTMKRWDDARAAANERLARLPRDEHSLRMLENIAVSSGDFKALRGHVEQLEKLGLAGSGDLNNAAYSALVDGTNGPAAIEIAQRAAQMEKSFPVQHTMAALLADLGRTAEANAFLLQAMDAANMAEPEENCWLVLGRMADKLGEKDAARARYKKSISPKDDGTHPMSGTALAGRWMKALP